MEFSVLMSAYSGTRVEDLAACLSSLGAQTVLADEIVLVLDGPLSEDTANYIKRVPSSLPIKTVPFSENRGLGHALRKGLLHCRHELVARVDTDDICIPERFQKQIDFLAEHPDIAVVGGGLREWYDGINGSAFTVRCGPLDPEGVVAYARKRNPLNHPTVLLRKSAVLASGSYKSCLMFEDYFLWARMIKAGYKIANMPEALVETQADYDYFTRRGGMRYVRYEFQFTERLVEIGFFSPTERILFLLARTPFRVLPRGIRSLLYKCLLRTSTKRPRFTRQSD